MSGFWWGFFAGMAFLVALTFLLRRWVDAQAPQETDDATDS